MIADLIKRGWSRRDVMESPLSQLLLEWDAAIFNEYCVDYRRAMAQYEMTLKELASSRTDAGMRQRAELLRKRMDLRDEFNKRQYLFWNGKELDSGDDRHS